MAEVQGISKVVVDEVRQTTRDQTMEVLIDPGKDFNF